MIETLMVVGLSVAGLAIVDQPRIDQLMRVVLAPVMGLGLFVMVGTILVAVLGHARPVMAVVIALVVALVWAAIRRDRLTTGWKAIGMVVVGVSVVALVVNLVHLTRTTGDSIRYIIDGRLLSVPDGLGLINPDDLLKRVTAAPLLQTLGAFDDARYSTVAAPILGLAGWVMTVLVLVRRMSTPTISKLAISKLAGGSLLTAFLALSNRPLLNLFYINTHGLVATCVLVLVYGGWLWVQGNEDWLAPMAVTSAMVVLARAEGGVLVAIIWLVILSHGQRRPSLRTTWATSVPFLAGAVWFGVVGLLSNLVRSRSEALLILASTLGPLVIAVIGFVRPRWLRMLEYLAGAIALVVLGVAAIADPQTMTASVSATVSNALLGAGGWGVTWPVLGLILLLVLVHGGPEYRRVWTDVLVGFGLMFWLLPFLREGAYREGTGDSGNRMLAHVFLMTVVVVILALTESRTNITEEPPQIVG